MSDKSGCGHVCERDLQDGPWVCQLAAGHRGAHYQQRGDVGRIWPRKSDASRHDPVFPVCPRCGTEMEHVVQFRRLVWACPEHGAPPIEIAFDDHEPIPDD